MLTLGESCLTVKGAGLAFQEILIYAGKTLAVDAVAVGATHGVGLLCQELGVPVPLTIILSFAAGMTVSLIGTKYVLKDSLGNMQFEFEGGKNSILSYEDAESIAFDAIHGSNKADAVVLGKYGDGGPTSYTSVTKDS